MNILIGNLLSGFIGAVAAVLLSILYNLYHDFNKHKEIRNSILKYHQKTVIPKIKTYIEDCKKANDTINDPYNKSIDRSYNMMPMLTKEFYKSYTSHELYKAVKTEDAFIELIDIYHAIDFLKKNMPLSIAQEFQQKINKHMGDKGELDRPNHFKTCLFCKGTQDAFIQNLELKIKTANELIIEINSLDNKINKG